MHLLNQPNPVHMVIIGILTEHTTGSVKDSSNEKSSRAHEPLERLSDIMREKWGGWMGQRKGVKERRRSGQKKNNAYRTFQFNRYAILLLLN